MKTSEHVIKYILDNNGETSSVYLPEDYVENIEDKFFIVRTFKHLLISFTESMINNKVDEKTLQILINFSKFIEDLDYDISKIVSENESTNNNEEIIEYDMDVETYGDLLNLPDYNIMWEDRIFEKRDGFKVYVKSEKKIYTYFDKFKLFLS